MTSWSWEYDGQKRLDNFFDHWFIRSALQPGWSASQGGPGPSSHTREAATKTYLQRPCVANPEGGPQDTSATHVHALRAQLSLAEVDLVRRKEYKRLQERAAVDEKLKVMQLNNDIKRNWGWPFNQGLPPKDVEEEVDEEALFREKPKPDWDRKWDREPFGRVVSRKEDEQDEHFHSWVGGLGWEDGYVQYFEQEVDPEDSTKVKREAGYYWTGPEKSPALLDQLVWKPMLKAGPEMVNQMGANKTVEAVMLGRNLETPEELQRKRVYGHVVRFKDVVNGGYKEVNMGDGKYFDTNVEARDPLTGIPLYSYKQRNHTVTHGKGHGRLDKNVLLERKKKKTALMEQQMLEFETEVDALKHQNMKTEERFLAKEGISRTAARDKIIVNDNKIQKIEKQMTEYGIRINREKREVKAIEMELQLEDAGKGLPIPKSLIHAMPKGVLDTAKAWGQEIGLLADNESEEEFYESAEEGSDDDSNPIIAFFHGLNRQKRKGMKTEKYFGKNLIDPATGKIDEAVLKRKNRDLMSRRKEMNKAVVDVYLSRSDGASKYNTLSFVPPDKRRSERYAREEQQQVVDSMVKQAVEQDTELGLEEWAKAERRKESTFGSSEHRRPKPVMQTVKSGDGSYMMMKTFTPPPSQVREDGKTLPKSAVGAKCSSGKVMGGGYYNPRFELLGWGPEDEGHFTTQQVGFVNRSAEKFVPASLSFAGRRVDATAEDAADRGPVKPGVVRSRKYNGTLPGDDDGPGLMPGRIPKVGMRRVG